MRRTSVHGVKREVERSAYPFAGIFGILWEPNPAVQSGEAKVSRNHLTELLDFSRHGSYSEANLHRAGRQARVQGRATRKATAATAGAGSSRRITSLGASPSWQLASPNRPRSRSRGRFIFLWRKAWFGICESRSRTCAKTPEAACVGFGALAFTLARLVQGRSFWSAREPSCL